MDYTITFSLINFVSGLASFVIAFLVTNAIYRSLVGGA